MTPPAPPAVAEPLYHLALEPDWAAAQQAGEYRVSTLGKTLDEQGYIHASYAHQVAATAERFYGAAVEPLVLLVIDPDRLGCQVRAEEAIAGGELFPHIYGPIPLGAVVSAAPFQRDPGRR